MIGGERMQKDRRRALAQHAVNDLRIAALDAVHSADLITE
jgi:hypothetical protein